jgi:hypothetical protein
MATSTPAPARAQALSRQDLRWWDDGAPGGNVNTFRQERCSRESEHERPREPLVTRGQAIAISVIGWSLLFWGAKVHLSGWKAQNPGPNVHAASQSLLKQKLIAPIAAHDARSPEPPVSAETIATGVAVAIGREAPISGVDVHEARTVPIDPMSGGRGDSTVEPLTLLDLPPSPIDETIVSEADEKLSVHEGFLLPELNDPLASALPGLMSVKEIFDLQKRVSESQLRRYRNEFPEIFVSQPAARTQDSPADQRFEEARDVVRRARNWRTPEETSRSATSEKRPRLVDRIGGLFKRRRS